MSLNCRLGDLAITVNCDIPQNLGRIVRVIDSHGLEDWTGHGPMHTWEVQTLSDTDSLTYIIKGRLTFKCRGPVPDAFLRPLNPPADEESLEETVPSQQLPA